MGKWNGKKAQLRTVLSSLETILTLRSLILINKKEKDNDFLLHLKGGKWGL